LRAKHGPAIAEIDIIAKKSGCFVFVEVKTVKSGGNFWLWTRLMNANCGKYPKLPKCG